MSWIGEGDLKKARKIIVGKDEEIEKLKAKIAQLQAEKKQLVINHKAELAKQNGGYLKEIAAAVTHAERAEKDSATKDKTIETLKTENKLLEREAHPKRYQLSSGAELVRLFPDFDYYRIHDLKYTDDHLVRFYLCQRQTLEPLLFFGF